MSSAENSVHCTILLASYWSLYYICTANGWIFILRWHCNTEACISAFQFLALFLSSYAEGSCCIIDLQPGNGHGDHCDSPKGPIKQHFVALTQM